MPTRANASQKTDATHVFLILWKTYRAIFSKSEESRKNVGLGDSDFRVLEALLHKGPLPVNVIGEKVELTTGSITTAIDRMEAKWLVVRKNHPDDRRVRLVELTAKGRRLIEKAYAQHSINMEKAMAVLSREERAGLIDLLKRLGKGTEESAFEYVGARRQTRKGD
jgi:MarR family transcriptional regulator, 2-MHQ and catechol-resistance regulon repressor